MANNGAIFINGNRSGYAPEQCGDTLTVDEFIQVLKDYADQYGGDALVYLENDNGYTYGEVTAWDTRFVDEDELNELNA